MKQYELTMTDYEADPSTVYNRFNHRGKMLNKTKSSLFIFDDGAVAFKHSSQHTGLNRHSKKQWYRWTTDTSVSIKKNAKGKYVPTSRTARGNWHGGGIALGSWLPYAENILEAVDSQGTRFRSVDISKAAKKIAPEDIDHIRSIVTDLRNLPLGELILEADNPLVVPKNGFQLIQEPDVASLTRTLFGKTRYRKDLVRAVARVSLQTSMLASSFRGYVPTDWIVRFLNESTEQRPLYANETDPTALRRVVPRVDQYTLRHLTTQGYQQNSMQDIVDILRYCQNPHATFEHMDGARVRTWTELHDILYPRRRFARGGIIRIPYTPPAPVEIKPSLAAQKIHDAFEGTKYTHLMPTGTEDLNAWSDTMGNCIRGYDQRAAAHKTILGALLVGEKMVVNYEVADDMTCRQLLGRFNTALDKTTHDEVRSIMEKAGVLFSGYYSGQVIGRVDIGEYDDLRNNFLDNNDDDW